MTIFSLVMLVTACCLLYFVLRSINKNKFLLESAGVWITIGIVLVIFSVFDSVPAWLADLFGFQLTSNFLLFLAVLFLLVITFIQSLQLSKQKTQINRLIQKVSLDTSERKKKE